MERILSMLRIPPSVLIAKKTIEPAQLLLIFKTFFLLTTHNMCYNASLFGTNWYTVS